MTFSFNLLGNFGHLGNQMFQYAAVKGLAKKHNREFMIPPKEVFGLNYPNLRSNIDECFNIDCFRGTSSGFVNYNEVPNTFDFEFFQNPPNYNINLIGYFQSNKWFEHIDHEIKKDFKFKQEYLDKASKIRDRFKEDVIGLHIRRTDYIPNNDHISKDISYFENSLKELPSECPVFVFSDDTEWCKNQELFQSERFFIVETNDCYVDLCLISLCNYIIGANSTYSWWGAYLSNAKKIIIPIYDTGSEKWVGSVECNNSKIYQSNWNNLIK